MLTTAAIIFAFAAAATFAHHRAAGKDTGYAALMSFFIGFGATVNAVALISFLWI